MYKGAKSVVVIVVCVFPCLLLCSTYKVFICGSTCVRYSSSAIQYTPASKSIKNLLAEIFHLNTQKFKNLFSRARSSSFLYVGHFWIMINNLAKERNFEIVSLSIINRYSSKQQFD